MREKKTIYGNKSNAAKGNKSNAAIFTNAATGINYINESSGSDSDSDSDEEGKRVVHHVAKGNKINAAKGNKSNAATDSDEEGSGTD